jgi:uncharacterized protein (DUF2141 family)
MKNKILILLSLLQFPAINVSSQTAKPMGTLTFNISGFSDNSGQVIVQLFRKEDKVPAKAFMQVKAKITDTKSTVKIQNLIYGDYGAIIVHDVNSNGIIDHKWGIPSEQLGYSNNWKLTLLSGMPTFKKLKFTFTESDNQFNVSMQ